MASEHLFLFVTLVVKDHTLTAVIMACEPFFLLVSQVFNNQLSTAALMAAYHLFLLASQVTPEQLMTALTTRAIETFGERIVKQLDAAAASVSRDALAKNLYAKLFDWLVAAINRKISAIGAPCVPPYLPACMHVRPQQP